VAPVALHLFREREQVLARVELRLVREPEGALDRVRKRRLSDELRGETGAASGLDLGLDGRPLVG
jgi:hypothetical protein